MNLLLNSQPKRKSFLKEAKMHIKKQQNIKGVQSRERR